MTSVGPKTNSKLDILIKNVSMTKYNMEKEKDICYVRVCYYAVIGENNFLYHKCILLRIMRKLSYPIEWKNVL